MIEIVEQTPCILADPEEPLLEQTLLDRCVAPLATSANDLLVSENGFAAGAPVNRCLFFVGQPFLQKLEKYPLGPLVVIGVCSGKLLPPIHHQTRALNLPL